MTLTYSIAPGLVFDLAFGYLPSDSTPAHRYVTSQYNAGAGLPMRRDIGVNPIATGRVPFSFLVPPAPRGTPLRGALRAMVAAA